jgi:hypothetical protein
MIQNSHAFLFSLQVCHRHCRPLKTMKTSSKTMEVDRLLHLHMRRLSDPLIWEMEASDEPSFVRGFWASICLQIADVCDVTYDVVEERMYTLTVAFASALRQQNDLIIT